MEHRLQAGSAADLGGPVDVGHEGLEASNREPRLRMLLGPAGHREPVRFHGLVGKDGERHRPSWGRVGHEAARSASPASSSWMVSWRLNRRSRYAPASSNPRSEMALRVLRASPMNPGAPSSTPS